METSKEKMSRLARLWKPIRGAAHWTTAWQLGILALLSPVVMFPGRWVWPAAALLAWVWIARWLEQGRPSRRTPFDLPLIILALLLPMSVLIAPDPALSWPKFWNIVLGLSLYYGLVNRLRSEQGLWQVSLLFPLLGLGIAGLGLVGTDWEPGKLPFLDPLYRLLPQRIIPALPRSLRGGFSAGEVAGALSVLIALQVGLIVALRRRRQAGETVWTLLGRWQPRVTDRGTLATLFLAAALIASLSILLLTQIRTGLMATGVALWLIALAHNRRWLIALPAGITGLAGAILVIGAENVAEFFLSLPKAQTWHARPELWGIALQAIHDYPLTGVGLYNFQPVARHNYAFAVASPEWRFTYVHNIFLQMGVDFGLGGLLAFLLLLAIFAILAYRLYRATADRPIGWLVVTWSAGMLAYLVFSLTHSIALGQIPSILFWLLLGLIAAGDHLLIPEKVLSRHA